MNTKEFVHTIANGADQMLGAPSEDLFAVLNALDTTRQQVIEMTLVETKRVFFERTTGHVQFPLDYPNAVAQCEYCQMKMAHARQPGKIDVDAYAFWSAVYNAYSWLACFYTRPYVGMLAAIHTAIRDIPQQTNPFI